MSSQLKDLLEQLSTDLGFEIAILFSIDKLNRQFSIVEYSGNRAFFNEPDLFNLIHSPVRDVAEDKEVFVIENSEAQSQSPAKIQYLLKLFPAMRACIGVPVVTELSRDLALFAVDKIPQQFAREKIMYVKAMANAIGTCQELQELRESTAHLQRFAIIGHLNHGMVHEINNLMGPLTSRVDNLELYLNREKRWDDKTSLNSSDDSMIKDEIAEIKKAIRKIIMTTRMFGRLTVQDRQVLIRVDEVINEVIHLLRDMCDRLRIRIEFTPPEQLLVLRVQTSALQQVILNVLLNAAQQIAAMRPNSGGRISIQIESGHGTKDISILRILIKDDGPGIESQLWERIFDLGYTTHSDGSGLGLYLSRHLMNEIGGHIYVKDSHISSGTTFAIEVPVLQGKAADGQELTMFF